MRVVLGLERGQMLAGSRQVALHLPGDAIRSSRNVPLERIQEVRGRIAMNVKIELLCGGLLQKRQLSRAGLEVRDLGLMPQGAGKMLGGPRPALGRQLVSGSVIMKGPLVDGDQFAGMHSRRRSTVPIVHGSGLDERAVRDAKLTVRIHESGRCKLDSDCVASLSDRGHNEAR